MSKFFLVGGRGCLLWVDRFWSLRGWFLVNGEEGVVVEPDFMGFV